MKIGELAAKAACDVQTIRYYEREGLLEAPEREASGYRRYAERHVARLRFIRHCRTLDIPLAEVRQLLSYAQAPRQSCHAVDALLDDHIDRVHRQIAAMTALERQLRALRGQCKGANEKRSCAIIDSFMNAPSEHACACHPAREAPAGA